MPTQRHDEAGNSTQKSDPADIEETRPKKQRWTDCAMAPLGAEWEILRRRGRWLAGFCSYVRKRVVSLKVERQQCWSETGNALVKTERVRRDPDCQDRDVWLEYNAGPRPDLFSATFPLTRRVVSDVAAGDDTVLMVDVRMATRRKLVELPEVLWSGSCAKWFMASEHAYLGSVSVVFCVLFGATPTMPVRHSQ